MIDLNYLYTYSTYKAKDRPPTAYEYLTANALVKQSKQNFGKYYEGLFTERAQEIMSDPGIALNGMDIFALALDSIGCNLNDFINASKRATTQKFNEVDTYFYHLSPDNRIFSAVNELRERGNRVFSSFAKRPAEVKSYTEICTEDFLFGEPIRSGISESTIDALAKLYYEETDSENNIVKVSPSSKEIMNLLSIFYLVPKDYRLVLEPCEQMPENISKNPDKIMSRIIKMIGASVDELDVEDTELLIARDELYEEWLDEYAEATETWEHSENFLDGLQFIKASGETRFTRAVDGKMQPVFEVCSNQGAVRRNVATHNSGSSCDCWTDVADFRVTKQQCEEFRDRIVGQASAVDEIVGKLVGVSCGFYTQKRPIASFLLNGPTGVGKTETAKALADTFFGGRLFTIDMSTFKNQGDVARLVGSAPGYIGCDEKVALLEFLEKNPNGVINFDEIDKCDRSCLSFLLSVLDEGKLTSAKGKDYKVENFIITCTTNQKAETSRKSANFNLDEIMSRTGDNGTPFVKEFLGRFDSILEYGDLSKDELKEILGKKIDAKISLFLQNRPDSKISLEYRESLLENILQDATYTTTGARALNGSIQKYFIRPITHYLVESASDDDGGEKTIVVAGDNELIVNGEIVKLESPKESLQKASASNTKTPEQQYIG